MGERRRKNKRIARGRGEKDEEKKEEGENHILTWIVCEGEEGERGFFLIKKR